MPHVTGLDHLVILVRDLDASAATWRKLGFTLSPRGVHSAAMGSANHTIMLKNDYFELLGLLAETERNAKWRDVLARRGEGLAGVALACDTAEAAREELVARGVPAGEIVAFSRPVETADGRKLEAAFRVFELASGTIPALETFVCGHLTREAVWLPELTSHPNGATGIAAVLALAQDPPAAAKPWAAVFGEGAIEDDVGGVRVAAGGTPLRVMKREELAWACPGIDFGTRPDGLAGIVFAVADLGACAAALGQRGTVFREAGPWLVVPPASANGTLVCFEGA